MKPADEFLSISSDPSFPAKLLTLIEELTAGATLADAAGKASIDRQELESVIASLIRMLEERAARNRSIREVLERRGPVKEITVFADGASRGNPGEAACAAIAYDKNGKELFRRTALLGTTTNNVAEYNGVLEALALAKELGAEHVSLKLDSELVVKQLEGTYKIKNANLKTLFEKAKVLIASFSSFTVEHIPREENAEADSLANSELDRSA